MAILHCEIARETFVVIDLSAEYVLFGGAEFYSKREF